MSKHVASPSRRTILQTVAGVSVVSVAGCVGGGNSGSGAQGGGTTEGSTEQDTGTGQANTNSAASQSVVHGAVEGGTTGVLVSVMKDQGFDEQHGIKIEPKYFTSPPNVQKQIVFNKDVPTGFMGSIVATRLTAQNKSPQLVGPYMLYHMYVLTKDGTGINGPEDLKGKKISWASKAADAWLKFIVILNKETGLKSSDLKFVQTAPPASISLLKKGELDAILLNEPLVTKALAQNDSFKVIFNPRKVWEEQSNKPLTTVDLAWDAKWYQENQDAGVSLAEATKETQAYIQGNIDSAVSNYKSAFGLESETEVQLAKERLTKIYPKEWSKSKFIDSGLQVARQAHDLGLIENEPSEKIFNWVL